MALFFKKNKLNPLICLCISIGIIIFSLINAHSIYCTYFLLGVYVILCFFGCFKQCLKMLPWIIIICGIFGSITYFVYGRDFSSSLTMVNRIFCLLVAGIIGCSVETLAITRSLSQIHTPRALTLGMLIATSFMPYLKEEIKRVLEAMKTRGAGSVFNPKVFYRAFIVPLIMRLVSLSDTLSLSIETRCFSINREDKYTIYKKEIFGFIDLVFVLLVGCGALMVVIL